jgi:hypothetical protein
MKFVMHRNRTIVSTCGHAVEFVKGELTHVPPSMYEEVMSAGAVPETELDLEPKAGDEVVEPTDPTARQQAIFEAFETVTLRGKREDFTAAGSPHAKVLSTILGWTVQNKERDTAWTAFKTKAGDE